MSELKVYEEMEDYVGYDECDCTPAKMYDKSEADNVIAELKAREDVLVTDNRNLLDKVKKLENHLRENAEHFKRNEAQILENADKVIADLEESHKKEVGQLLIEIAKLKEERRWRKCSEELPDDGAEVLATDGDGIWLCYKTTMSDGSPWFQPDGLPHIEGVTHWMPLPSAPKEER